MSAAPDTAIDSFPPSASVSFNKDYTLYKKIEAEPSPTLSKKLRIRVWLDIIRDAVDAIECENGKIPKDSVLGEVRRRFPDKI